MDLDPRLVELYDVDNPGGVDHEWFRALADRLDARTIVDLGCGTGLLTVSLCAPGRRVIGIDPDASMVSVAGTRDGHEAVRWVLGDSSSIGAVAADLVLMTGNVAQHIDEQGWERTLADISAALRPGGRLAFESRTPEARAWEEWTREKTYGVRDTPHGPLIEWMDVVDVTGPTVTYEAHNVFESTSEHLVYTESLVFRSADRIGRDLAAAGLRVEHIWGGWSGQRATPASTIQLFEASRP